MSQYRWCPLDRVDLGHKGAVDDAGFVEDLITGLSLECARLEAGMYSPCPFGVPFADRITDGVMFESEQSVQHLNTQPPIVVEACLGSAVAVARQEDLLAANSVEDEFAVLVMVPETRRDDFARAIYLRAVPPRSVHVAIAWACVV
jgi:hypothetical protein